MFYAKSKVAAAMAVAYLLSSTNVRSQSPVPEFGVFSAAEKAMKECSFDKEADAVVLLDNAVSTYTETYALRTTRRIRLKILKERGVERGNIHIPFYSDDHYEVLLNPEATVLSFDNQGREVSSKLERKLVFTTKLNKYYSEMTFALPNVKVGSIIEYKYESEMKNYGGLREWVFQSDMPVVKSTYYLTIVPNAEFAYGVYKIADLPIKITPDKPNGAVEFEMENVPGLREEAFMSSRHDYLQRVKFQFSGYSEVHESGFGSSTASKTNYTNTWKKLGQELMDDGDFGSQINKTLPGEELLQQGWAKETDEYTRMKAIHNYVKSHFSWNGMYSKYATEGLKNIWEKKSGTNGEINLLMVNLLKSAGLAAQPLLVSERSHGKVDTSYPFIDQFSQVVAYVTVNGSHYVLDGTDRQTPSDIIPFDLLNTTAFAVDRKNGALVKITDVNKKRFNLVHVAGDVTKDGTVKLQADVNDYSYAKLESKEKYEHSKQKYERDFFETYKLPAPDTFVVDGVDVDSLPMHHNAKVHFALNKTGDYYLLNYNLFTGYNKNPFVTEQRFSDINFGCASTCEFSAIFTLPDNLMPEALPKNLKMMMPDQSMLLVRQVQQHDKTIQIDFKIDINRTEFEADEYYDVQDFYKRMMDLLNEPIVLKAKS